MAKLAISSRMLRRLPRRARRITDRVALIFQYGVPLPIWGLLLWLINPADAGKAFLAAGAIYLVSVATAGVWALLALRFPPRAQVVRKELTLERWPKELDGFTILQISDLHVSPLLTGRKLRRRLAPAWKLEADLLVVTGDLASGRKREAAVAAKIVASLPAREGRYAVLGNHDHWIGPKFVKRVLSRRGIQVLVNQAVAFERNGARFWLVGSDDCAYRRRDNLPLALQEVPAGEVKILLSHSPDLWTEAVAAGVDLMLSGHTHGGQIVLPGLGALVVPSRQGRRRASGHFQEGKSQLYINRGLGEIFPPVRLNCPPEVTLFVLRSSTARQE